MLLSGLVAALAVFAVASPAQAASVVPYEVSHYIATQLVDDLNEFYGPGAKGAGVDFTDKTTATGGTRVFAFTDDFLAGAQSEPIVKRRNDWVSIIAIDKAIVGFAVVTIDPVTDSAQLGSFTASADFGTVVAALPETATLVRDDERSAWFSLDGEQLTPIVAGTSRVTEPISVADYREIVGNWPKPKDAAQAPQDASGPLLIVGLVVVLIVLVLALEAFLPFWRKRAKSAEPEERGEEKEPAPE